jgi:HPr kinase/phosphorylase
MKRPVVSVQQFFTDHASDLQMRLVAGETGLPRLIREPTVNRPGLLLAGFTKYFARYRVQVIGDSEFYYLRSLPVAQREQHIKDLFRQRLPCVVFSRDHQPDKLFLRLAEAAKVPVFESSLITMKFINKATLALEAMFAPHGSEMGSMVDILGVGVIIKGESGIGKSECVLALIERGYSLVADDVTKVYLAEGREVMGTSVPLTRNHMEVRGIGIINVAAMFGVKAIRLYKRLDLVVTLKPWEQVPDVERVGEEQEFTEILEVKIPHITLPVRPGRDLARLIEVAAFQQKLKSSGYNPAKELNDRLIAQMGGKQL